jgi:hypothetical protein
MDVDISSKNLDVVTKEQEDALDWLFTYQEKMNWNFIKSRNIKDALSNHYNLSRNITEELLDDKILHLYSYHCKDVVEGSLQFKNKGNWEIIYEASGRFIETMIDITITKFGVPQSEKDFASFLTKYHQVYFDGEKKHFDYFSYNTLTLFYDIRREKIYSKRVKIMESYFSDKFLAQWEWLIENLKKPETKRFLKKYSYRLKNGCAKSDLIHFLSKIKPLPIEDDLRK